MIGSVKWNLNRIKKNKMHQYRPQNKQMNLMLNQSFEYPGCSYTWARLLKVTAVLGRVSYLGQRCFRSVLSNSWHFCHFLWIPLSIKQRRIKSNLQQLYLKDEQRKTAVFIKGPLKNSDDLFLRAKSSRFK